MTVSPIGVHCKEASAETHASLLELLVRFGFLKIVL